MHVVLSQTYFCPLEHNGGREEDIKIDVKNI